MVISAYEAFLNNYNDMKADNTKEADKYFHAKANCEAGQIKDFAKALLLDSAREGSDFLFNNPYRKRLEAKENIQDCYEDFKANLYGLYQGAKNPDANCKDLIKKYRVNGINEKY